MVEGARTPLTVDLTGYKVAISGGANGIGKIMADSFAYCGASVFVSDVDTQALDTCGHKGMKADAGDPTQCEAFIDAAVKHLGGLDVLVNNAGIAGPTALVEHVTPEELDATLRIDVASMFHMSRRAIPVLRANGGGRDCQFVLRRRALRVPAAGALFRGKVGGGRVYQVAVDRAGARRHPGQRDIAGAGRRAAYPRGDQGKGSGSGDLGKRDDGTHSGDDEPQVLCHAARHCEHGAVSSEPIWQHDQRAGNQHRWRYAVHDVAPRAFGCFEERRAHCSAP
jgi:NAD(P)-dependent dehydrogenase (short-subunit alcohol dehydrogenase family)